MNRIVLSEDEIKIIEKDRRGEFDEFLCSEEEKRLMMSVLDKAENLMHELEAYEESGDDLLAWFYEKYKSQG